MADFTPGDVSIRTLDLFNYRGERLDILSIWGSIEIFEDMFDHAITARVYLIDAQNLIERFPIIGQERLVIKYSTPSFPEVKLELETYDIPIREMKRDNVGGYYLELMTKDGIKARTSFVQAPFFGNPVSAINSILGQTLNSTRKVDSDDLVNDLKFIAPRQRPFEAINTICNKSFTSFSADSPDVMFYDTVDGYKVKSLYGLMTQPAFAKYYFEDSVNRDDRKTKEGPLYQVGNYTIQSPGSVVSRITGGSYGGTLGVFDVTRRKYTEKTYGITTDAKNFSILNKNPGVDTNSDLIKGAHTSNYRYVIKGTKDHSLLERTARIDQVFAGMRIVADFPGNSSLRVGQVVSIEAPSPNPEEIARPDKITSGKYLLASIRHVMTNSTINNYRTVVELVKDSVKLKL
jgi:hypothetical protein